MTKGKLIVIDGLDGSGKATQTKILVESLTKEGRPVQTLDFPQYDNNFFGRMVRQYLDGKFGPATQVNPYLASLLYAGDRWESAPKINQWLQDGQTVILDRYYTSNLIHQIPKLDESQTQNYIEWLNQLEFEVFQIPKPDLVLFLYVPAQIAHQLIARRGQGHDGHDALDYMKKTESRCVSLAKKLGWVIIECCKNGKILPPGEIALKIRQQLTI